MFQSDFQEGATLAKNETCRVPLPDDNSEAMHTLCLGLHHQTHDIPYAINIELLHNLAVATDKYACSMAMSHWARECLSGLLEKSTQVVQKTRAFFTLLYFSIRQVPSGTSRSGWFTASTK